MGTKKINKKLMKEYTKRYNDIFFEKQVGDSASYKGILRDTIDGSFKLLENSLENFEEYLSFFYEDVQKTFKKKQKEYCKDRVMVNHFLLAKDFLDTKTLEENSYQTICFNYALKHVTWLQECIENNHISNVDVFTEKLGDTINYLCLLYVLDLYFDKYFY